MPLPFLSGNSVYLAALEEADAGYVRWLNDAEICRYNGHHRFPKTLEQGRAYLRSTAGDASTMLLGAFLLTDDSHVGNVSLQNIDWVCRSGELAVLFGAREHWGKGYATEACGLVLRHAFHELGLNRVYCGTGEDNAAMQKLAERLGMRREGVRRQAHFKNGRFLDIVDYGILASEYGSADA